MANSSIKGTPGFLLIPAREHKWKIVRDNVAISVPKVGFITELIKNSSLSDEVKIPGEDEFYAFEDNTFYLYQVPRVLFALGKYPSLENDQAFNVYAIIVEGDEIVLHGAVIGFEADGE